MVPEREIRRHQPKHSASMVNFDEAVDLSAGDELPHQNCPRNGVASSGDVLEGLTSPGPPGPESRGAVGLSVERVSRVQQFADKFAPTEVEVVARGQGYECR